MRNKLVYIVCVLTVTGVALDLFFHPIAAQAQNGGRTVAIVDLPPRVKGSTPINGSVVGFSCVVDRERDTHCYLATQY